MSVASTAVIVTIVVAITFSTFQSLGTDPSRSSPSGSRLSAATEATPRATLEATPSSGASDEALQDCTVPIGEMFPRIQDMSVLAPPVLTDIASPAPGVTEPVSIVRVDASVPASIVIEEAQVDAAVQNRTIVDGIMRPPSGPSDVAWYQQTGLLGVTGNVVMVGYADYWDVGPAVFFELQDLEEGDEIVATGTDGSRYVYTVDWVKLYDIEGMTDETVAEIVGPTQEASITLITCGGEFDFDRGVYLSRVVVRGTLKTTSEGTPVPAR